MSTGVVSVISPQEWIGIFEQTFIARYILFGVYTFLLLEHLAYIPEEVEVWKSSWNVAKAFFLIYRYSAVAGLTVVMHVIAGITNSLDILVCKRIVAAMIAMATLSMALADALVVLRVSVLWGRQLSVLFLLTIAFFLSCTAAVACAVLAATGLVAHTILVPIVKICVPLVKPRTIYGVWIPGIAFDLLVLILAGYNAFSRPRNDRTKLTEAMYRDGIMFFIILAGLRLVNFLVALFTTQFLLSVCATWAISAVTLSRFVFHLRSVENGTSSFGSRLSFGPVQDVDGELLEQLPRLPRLSGENLPLNRWPGGSDTVQSRKSSHTTAQGSDFFAG